MKNILTTLAVFALLFTTTSLYAAYEGYLELQGIKGEGKGKVFKGTIDKNGVAKMSNLLPGEYNVKMCATGQHIKTAKLFVRKQGKDQQDYYKIEISSLSFGATQTNTNAGGVHVASGDVDGDGRADGVTPNTKAKGIITNNGTGGGSGKASFSDLSFSMKTSDGKTSASSGGGGGAGKVSLQDIHFTMKPAPSRGKDMFEGQVGTVSIVGPSDSQPSDNSFFDIFVDID